MKREKLDENINNLINKNCRICGENIMAKKYATFIFCDKCKQTDEYKSRRSKFNNNNVKGLLVEKECKFCDKKLMVKNFTSMVICDECKKSPNEKQKEYFRLRQKKTSDTVEEKYGVKNSFLVKDKDDILKRDKTCIEKYGVDSPQKSKEIQNKTKETNLKLYGFENHFQDVEKIKNSYIEKLGVSNPNKCEFVRDKIRKTNLKKYGVTNFLTMPEVLLKGSNTRLERYGRKYPISFNFTKPHRVLKNIINKCFCNNNFETESFVTLNKRAYSIDELDRKNKIAIFVDGDYWHGNPMFYNENDIVIGKIVKNIWEYDKTVTNELKSFGYTVLRFWEFDIYKNIDKCIDILKNSLVSFDLNYVKGDINEARTINTLK
jgi:hypothetical protein